MKVRWKTLRDGFVRHLKKKKTLETYTAAAAMRPYKLEKQIEFLFPHVSFRDEDGDDVDAEDDGGGGGGGRAAVEDAAAWSTQTDRPQRTQFDDRLQRAADAETLYEQSVDNYADRSCSEHDALDRSIHFLCDQRYRAPAAAATYRRVG